MPPTRQKVFFCLLWEWLPVFETQEGIVFQDSLLFLRYFSGFRDFSLHREAVSETVPLRVLFQKRHPLR
jgi:hypothetical protein